MSQYRVTFDSPWYLILLILVPILWWLSYRGLAPLGRSRRWMALVLRSLIVVLFVLAAAETQMVRISQRLTVLYLLDRSLSIPPDTQKSMIEYLNAAIEKHRAKDDRVGVIAFGREAVIEVPAFDYNVQLLTTLETPLAPDYTNLASAMRLALASFPEDSARRIVVLSDGNENLGSALEEAQALAGAGVGIDVVPVHYQKRGEVILDRVILPNDVRRGQPYDVKIVVTNTKQATANDSGEVSGRLVLMRMISGRPSVVSDEKVKLPPGPPGKRVFTVKQQLDQAAFCTYRAVFVPDRDEDDTMQQNNQATAFTHVKGKGKVLLIENVDNPAQCEHVVRALGEHNIEVEVRPSNQLFASLGELQQYDSVILANVPKDAFVDDKQVEMLVRNTQQMGAGLVMLGGPEAFGAGGWANSELEKAMPVDFTIKSTKVIPRGALAMLMHASEIAQGNFWQTKIAEEAMKALGPRDYCGVIQWGGGGPRNTTWLWTPGMAPVGENREMMVARLSKMTPQDMPDFDPGMILAHQGLVNAQDAGVRHLIIISDGDPTQPSNAVVNSFVRDKITISTVAVGAHGAANSNVMRIIANSTGGKYYEVNNPNALPKIFQREARRVTVRLIHENPAGMLPRVTFAHEMLSGIESLPPITGFVLTTRKENPLVEVAMIAPEPGIEENRTLLASWTYGLGRTVALTTDATSRWSRRWLGWQDYNKLVSQIIRWSMRPVGDDGKFTVAADFRDGKVVVAVSALNKDDEYINFLEMPLAVVGPSLQIHELKMEQVAPGRYVASFPASEAGGYMIMVQPGAERAQLRTGINVPYSDEFRNVEPNQALLEQLAQLVPEGGVAGELILSPDGFLRREPLLEFNSFRHDLARAASSQDVWPFLLLTASCLFFFDVFVRRVQMSFAWVPVVTAKVLGRKPPPPAAETIQRLQSRKAEVGDRIAQLRAGARFEPSPEVQSDLTVIEEPAAGQAPPRRTPAAPSMAQKPSAEESYTARLLKAKQKAWERQNQGGRKP